MGGETTDQVTAFPQETLARDLLLRQAFVNENGFLQRARSAQGTCEPDVLVAS